MGFIRTTGLQGSRKQEIKIEINNETGKKVFGAVGEVETLGQDKRRKKKSRDHTVLAELSRNPRLDLIYNLSTHLIEIRHSGGVHYWYLPVDHEILAKISSAVRVGVERKEGSPSRELLEQWYDRNFENKIKAANKRRFAAWRLRRASRNRGAPPPYKPHRKRGAQKYDF